MLAHTILIFALAQAAVCAPTLADLTCVNGTWVIDIIPMTPPASQSCTGTPAQCDAAFQPSSSASESLLLPTSVSGVAGSATSCPPFTGPPVVGHEAFNGWRGF
ncbi:hypothetical protein BD779DRAFT_1673721 [Infundibulicybe gibba]|nr:hypothetical protein BD779DRAFT_1673721 [Infundibulicybe gibba]